SSSSRSTSSAGSRRRAGSSSSRTKSRMAGSTILRTSRGLRAGANFRRQLVYRGPRWLARKPCRSDQQRVARTVILAICMTVLTAADLNSVCGGGADLSALGRCGPGSGWKWLGNVYTPECKAHDLAVRGELAKGSSQLGAQLKALPLLPAA